MRLGMLVRSDRTGLGQGQTLRLSRLLMPDKVMIIDSTTFNGNAQFHEWYKGVPSVVINGFPADKDVASFLKDLDVVLTCETWYSHNFISIARSMGVKTVAIYNYEFMDHHKQPNLPLPDKIVMPSKWHLDEMEQNYGATYLPTPLFRDEFSTIAQHNLHRKGKRRYLFINGRQAVHDRNGLLSLYDALKYAKGDFEIVIRAQGEIPLSDDSRIVYDLVDEPIQGNLYKGYDALIMPRRYGGQCLPMTEALVSGLPVVMTDIEPNNKILPQRWLCDAIHTGSFMTRTSIDMYSAVPTHLASILDNLDVGLHEKEIACYLGGQFLADNLKEEYKELVEKW